jgi:hypothetical protein
LLQTRNCSTLNYFPSLICSRMTHDSTIYSVMTSHTWTNFLGFFQIHKSWTCAGTTRLLRRRGTTSGWTIPTMGSWSTPTSASSRWNKFQLQNLNMEERITRFAKPLVRSPLLTVFLCEDLSSCREGSHPSTTPAPCTLPCPLRPRTIRPCMLYPDVFTFSYFSSLKCKVHFVTEKTHCRGKYVR